MDVGAGTRGRRCGLGIPHPFLVNFSYLLWFVLLANNIGQLSAAGEVEQPPRVVPEGWGASGCGGGGADTRAEVRMGDPTSLSCYFRR